MIEALKLPSATIIGVAHSNPYRTYFSVSVTSEPPWPVETSPHTIRITPKKPIPTCTKAKIYAFSFRIQTASITVNSGPKFRKIDTVTIGSLLIV